MNEERLEVRRRESRRIDASAIDQQHAVSTRQDVFQPVLRDDHRGAASGDLAHSLYERDRAVGVELGQRFVEHQQTRLECEHPGQREPLALAARQRIHRAAGERTNAGALQRVVHALHHRLARHAKVLQPECDVAVDRRIHGLQLGVLKQKTDIPRQFSGLVG